MQHHGRGVAPHRRDVRPHRAGLPQHRVREPVRVPPQPRGGQVGDQAPAPDAPREQHRGRGLRPRRLRGQPAQPHQAHDQRGQGELCRRLQARRLRRGPAPRHVDVPQPHERRRAHPPVQGPARGHRQGRGRGGRARRRPRAGGQGVGSRETSGTGPETDPGPPRANTPPHTGRGRSRRGPAPSSWRALVPSRSPRGRDAYRHSFLARRESTARTRTRSSSGTRSSGLWAISRLPGP